MRTATLLLLLAAPALADDATKTKARAGLDLALASQRQQAKAVAATPRPAGECDHTCCGDAGEMITKALADPKHPPVVYFVGLNPTPATAKALSPAMMVRLRDYEKDGRGGERRVILNLYQGAGYYRVAAFGPEVTAEAISAEIKARTR